MMTMMMMMLLLLLLLLLMMMTITNTYAKIHSYSARYMVYGVAATAVLVHVDVSSHHPSLVIT